MMTRFAAAAALLPAASLTTATAAGAEPGDTVTYNVDADGPLILVSYHDEMDNLQQLTNQLAPWSTSCQQRGPRPEVRQRPTHLGRLLGAGD
jgi:hypothetical protein